MAYNILNDLRDGILVINRNQTILFANKAAQHLLNHTIHANSATLIEWTRSEQLSQLADQIIRDNSSATESITLPNYRGRDLKFHISPLKDDGHAAAVITIYDMTELNRLERLRKDFVANVSHELKTPLTSLKGFIETLLTNKNLSPDQQNKFFSIMQEDADRLERLIRDVLELSRIEAGQSDPSTDQAELNLTIEEALRLLEPQILARSIKVEKLLLQDPIFIHTGRDELKQVFINLLDNAIKYSNTGGSILIKVKPESNRQIKISITDHGIGIAPDKIDRIFERFFRGDPARSRELGGTGLGLSIVKHIVEHAGGKVGCESVVGSGSTFFVILSHA